MSYNIENDLPLPKQNTTAGVTRLEQKSNSSNLQLIRCSSFPLQMKLLFDVVTEIGPNVPSITGVAVRKYLLLHMPLIILDKIA